MTKYQVGKLLVSLAFVSSIVVGCAAGTMQDQTQTPDRLLKFDTFQHQQDLPELGWGIR